MILTASYNVSNFQQLKDYINKNIEKVLTRIADSTLSKLKENVEKTVYSNPQSDFYKRTRQILNSISRTDIVYRNGGYSVEIYFDALTIQPIIRNNNLNAHADFSENYVVKQTYTGSISYDNLIAWLEFGTPGNKVHQHPENKFLRDTITWIKQEYKTMFIKEMKNLGISIS